MGDGMCNTTVYQFLSGFLVGVVLCFWITGFSQHFYVVRNSASSNKMFGVPMEVAEYSLIARILRDWMISNDSVNVLEKAAGVNDSKSSNQTLYFKSKTVITCIVPLLGDVQKYSQLESRIIITWTDKCDHVVFIQQRRTSITDRKIKRTIKKFLLRRNIDKKISISYLLAPGNSSEFGQKAGSLRSQYKAIQFAIMKYPGTSLFIITPTSTDVVTDFFERFKTGSSIDISSFTERLRKVLSPENTRNSNTILSLDNCILLDKYAASNLIRMVALNKCPLDNSSSFQEWAANCT